MKFGAYSPEGDRNGASYTRGDIERAIQKGEILEGRAVRCDGDLTLTVDLGCMRGIIPREEAALTQSGEVKNIAIITRVGKNICFKATAFTVDKYGNHAALLSRRAAQEEAFDNYISTLKTGQIVSGRITHIEKFGAFVDIGCGYISLLPIDGISVSRITNPADRFKVGDSIKAVVKSVEEGGRKITLSHKELLGTWEENAAEFEIGQTAVGKIRSVESYGIFVELTPNLAGLAEYRADVKVGQSASVFIKNIIPDRMKIKLVIVDSFDDDEGERPIKYFINEGKISRWTYTPENCAKLIESTFE